MHRAHAGLSSAQPLLKLQQSRRRFGQFSRALRGWKTSIKSPKAEGVLVCTGREFAFPGWRT